MDSLIVRLNESNYYESPELLKIMIKRSCDSQSWKEPQWETYFDVVSQFAGLPIEELVAATGHRFSSLLIHPKDEPQQTSFLLDKLRIRHIWGRNSAQFCPQCLEQDPYHRLIWKPIAISVCLDHQCFLQKHCPNCQKVVSIREVTLNKCKACNCQLSSAEIKSIKGDSFGLKAQATLRDWFMGVGYEPQTPKTGSDLTSLSNHPYHPRNVMYHLLYGMMMCCKIINYRSEFWHTPPFERVRRIHQPKQLATSEQCYLLYTTAFQGLIDWPNGFYNFLNACRDHGENELVYGRVVEDFGRAYTVYLERNWRYPAFQFVQDAFDNYLLKHYVISPSIMRLRRFKDNPRFAEFSDFVTYADAASILKVAPSTIDTLVSHNKLISFSGTLPITQARAYKLVRRDEVNALLEEWRQGITLKKVSKLFGVYE